MMKAKRRLPPPTSTVVADYGQGNIRVRRYGSKRSILIVALSRPKVKNAFSDGLYLDLIDVMQDTASDASLSAIILTGTGSYFSSGADLKQGTFLSEDGTSRDTLNLPAGRFMMALLGFPKVICAAVQGPAVGIGVTLLMHCDLCYCTTTATLWIPFTRLALVPELCSSVTLLETMGLSKANELLLLGKRIDSQTALQWNVCSQVVSGCDNSGDPFHHDSLACRMANEVDHRILSLPLGEKTSQIFVSMVRGRRKARMEEICRGELRKLDGRFDSGECLEAAMQIKIGKQSKL